MPLRTIDKRELWHRLLVISGLSAAAVAAPLLDLYGNSPEVFVANRSTGGQIVLFGLLVALALPLLALALLTIARTRSASAPSDLPGWREFPRAELPHRFQGTKCVASSFFWTNRTRQAIFQ